MNTPETIRAFLASFDSPHTRRAYKTDVKAFLRDVDDLRRATPTDVGDHIRAMERSGRAAATVRRRLSAVRRLYDWLVDRGTMDRNPARAYRHAPSPAPAAATPAADAPSTLSRSETERFLQATAEAGESSVRDRGLVLTILYGALRRAEVAAMNVEHVRPLGRHWVVDVPEGASWSAAYVKVPALVVEAIDAVRDRYGIEGGALWRSLSNRNRGARLTPDAIYKVVRRTARRAGLEGVDVEALRHTGLRLAVEAGASLQQVQVHARLQSATSADRYAPAESRPGRLQENAADFVELDVPTIE